MKVRYEEVKPVLTEVVGIVTAEVYLDEGIYSVYILGTASKLSLVVCAPLRTAREKSIG